MHNGHIKKGSSEMRILSQTCPEDMLCDEGQCYTCVSVAHCNSSTVTNLITGNHSRNVV